MRLLPGTVSRLFRVRPWLPLVSIALLGTAIGVHTAIFAAVDIVLLRPLPFPDPERLIAIGERKLTADVDDLSTPGNYRDLLASGLASGPAPGPASELASGPPLIALGAYASADPALFSGDTPQSFETMRVTSSLFRVLGTGPARGRLFTPEEEASGADVAILTDSAWTRTFGRSEQIVGSRIDLDGIAHTVIGIAPPEAGRLLRADVLRPFAFARLQGGRGERVVHLVGRLANDVTGLTMGAARDALSQRVASLETIARQNEGFRAASVVPLQDRLVAGVRAPIVALEILALFIIIVVAANLVGLQFARLEWRAREMAIRTALGASGRRLVGEALVESFAIATAALALGLLVGHWMLAIGKATLIAPGLLQPLHLDARAIASAAIVAVGVGLGSGLCSVLMLLTRDVSQLLQRASTAVGPGRLTQRAQALVVITQTALALVFIVVAFTLIADVARQLRIDPGFRTEALWTVDIKTVGGPRVQRGVQPRQYAELLDAVRTLPGVEAAGAINSFPLLGLPGSLSFRVRDVPVPGSDRVQFRLVMPGYFDALGLPIRQGRDFAVSDDRSQGTAALVAIVNRAFADRYWPGVDPVGRDVAVLTSPWIHVIGVVDNIRSIDLNQPPVPELYVSPLQVSSSGEMTLALRTHAGVTLTASAVRTAMQRVAPGVAVARLGAVDTRLAEQRTPQRFGAAFLTLLALLAMGLAAAGTYSLVAYAVSSRRREMAIRRVLGAGEGQIRWRMASQAALFIVVGTACGVGAVVTLARVYKSLLPGGYAIDPLIVAEATAVLIALSVLASYLPVRRAIERPLREVLLSD
jgi:putative ABC transport system permease protein